MQHLPLLSVIQRAIRSRICTECFQRPPQSENWRPMVVRACEVECPIFANLPQLAALAKRQFGNDAASVEQSILESICINCHATTSGGDYCEKRHTRSCSLSRHASETLHAIGPVLRRRSHASTEVRPITKAR